MFLYETKLIGKRENEIEILNTRMPLSSHKHNFFRFVLNVRRPDTLSILVERERNVM